MKAIAKVRGTDPGEESTAIVAEFEPQHAAGRGSLTEDAASGPPRSRNTPLLADISGRNGAEGWLSAVRTGRETRRPPWVGEGRTDAGTAIPSRRSGLGTGRS